MAHGFNIRRGRVAVLKEEGNGLHKNLYALVRVMEERENVGRGGRAMGDQRTPRETSTPLYVVIKRGGWTGRERAWSADGRRAN